MGDAVSRFLDNWSHLHPDLDLTSMAAMGRVLRLAALMNNITEQALTDAEVTRPEFEILAALRRSPHGLRPRPLPRATTPPAAPPPTRPPRPPPANSPARPSPPAPPPPNASPASKPQA